MSLVDENETATVQTGPTVELAAFASGIGESELPAAVAHQARRALVDHLAVTLAGSADPASATLRRTVSRLGSGERATVVGTSMRAGAPYAALLNGYAAHVLDFDDVFNPGRTTVHGSASVWPVIFALGETTRVSGARAVEAFVAGFEVEARVGDAAGPNHYELGWHVTGTAGHVGAAAAAARVLGLSPAETANAMGAAATQAAGLKELYGSDCKPLHPAKSAMDGLLAGIAAQEGFTATPTSLEGRQGLLRLVSRDPDPERLVAQLGGTWHLAANGYKIYPSGSLTHPAVDALLALVERHDIAPASVSQVHGTVHPYAVSVTGNPSPRTGTQAKFSLPHCAAVAVMRRRLSPLDFDEATVADPEIAALRAKVRLDVDPSLSKRAAEISVTLTDGQKVTEVVRENRGTPGNPVTDADLEAKFLTCAEPVLGASRARSVLDRCWELHRQDDIAAIVTATAGAAS